MGANVSGATQNPSVRRPRGERRGAGADEVAGRAPQEVGVPGGGHGCREPSAIAVATSPVFTRK